MMASAHRVSARSSGELGEPDFGGALQRWLNLERHRIVGEFSHLDQVQAVAEAYARPADVARPATAPPSRQISNG